jgi:hypothetical protein
MHVFNLNNFSADLNHINLTSSAKKLGIDEAVVGSGCKSSQ